MPQYELDGNKDDWAPHHSLQLVHAGLVLKPPPEMFNEPPYEPTKKIGDRVFYRSFPLAERRENLVDDDGPAPASEQRAAASLADLLD